MRSLLGIKKFKGVSDQSQDAFLIPYTQARLSSILIACALPRNDPVTGLPTQWHVNSFLYGLDGIKTKLKDTYIVSFKDPWHSRPILSDEHSQMGFKILDNVWCIVRSSDYLEKTMFHKYKDQDIVLHADHEKALEHIDEIYMKELTGQKPISGWNLFRATRKHMGLPQGGTATVCAPYWKQIELNTTFKHIAKQQTSLPKKIQSGIEYLSKMM